MNEITTVIAAGSAVVAGGATGWFALRVKRVEVTSPDSVAGGYSRLVADLQESIERMRSRSAEVETMLVEFRAAAEKAIEAEHRCLVRLASMEAELAGVRARLSELEATL